jgi:hypothetical protein
MKPISVRINDETFAQVEAARIDAGLSRTDWLRAVVTEAVTSAPPPPPPEPLATQFCTHPPGKRVDRFCVACGVTV